jgi:hypothetical protein
MGMMNYPDRIWAWYDTEYEVVSGGLKKFPFDLALEYVRADLVDPVAIREVSEADKIAIRNAALREAADVVYKWWFGDGNELPQELILALIGEKK